MPKLFRGRLAVQEHEHEGKNINVRALLLKSPLWRLFVLKLKSKTLADSLLQSNSGQPNIPRGGPRGTMNQETVFMSCTTSPQRDQIVAHILTQGFALKS